MTIVNPEFVAMLVIWVVGAALALRQEPQDRRRFPSPCPLPDRSEASPNLAHVPKRAFAHSLAVWHQEIEDDRALCSCRRIQAPRVCATYEQKRWTTGANRARQIRAQSETRPRIK
jgi:hypothetical protein